MDNLPKPDDGEVTQDTQIHRIPNDPQDLQRNTQDAELSANEVLRKREIRKSNALVVEHFGRLSLTRAMEQAIEWNEEEFSANPWRTPLFTFTHWMKGFFNMNPKQNCATAKRAFVSITQILKAWSHEALQGQRPRSPYAHHVDPWLTWLGIAKSEAEAEFLDVWQKIRFTPGFGPLQQAVDRARSRRIVLPQHLQESRPVDNPRDRSEIDYEFFLSLAAHLQVVMGANPIQLPCGKLGEILGLSKMTISRYRQWGIEDGFLRIEKPHRFRSRGGSDATDFRFILERVPFLHSQAQKEPNR